MLFSTAANTTFESHSAMEDHSLTTTDFMGNHGNDISFEDLVQHESIQKERTLLRIAQARRERSGSNLSLDKIMERPSRVDKYSKESIDVEEGDSDDDDDDEDEDGEKDGRTKDLRKALFEAIPEPYPHTLNYQKVCITDAGDPTDYDTKDACAKLKVCMDLRDKWINAHPAPPQDLPNNSPRELPPNSPDHPTNGKTKQEASYRRRLPPTYEIFGVPLPHTMHNLQFKMVKGVVMVHNIEPTFIDSPLGLRLTTDSTDAAEDLDALRRRLNENAKADETAIDQKFNTQAAAVVEEDGQDWSQSIFPVHDYNQYVKDYYTVSIWYCIFIVFLLYFDSMHTVKRCLLSRC